MHMVTKQIICQGGNSVTVVRREGETCRMSKIGRLGVGGVTYDDFVTNYPPNLVA